MSYVAASLIAAAVDFQIVWVSIGNQPHFFFRQVINIRLTWRSYGGCSSKYGEYKDPRNRDEQNY